MGLPSELLPYAENIYRRFPEEFIALGMPGLEEIFDLRPHGTWSRRLFETPAEKTIEITLRRRAPLLPQLPSPMGASLFGGASLSSLPAFSGLASPQQTAIDAQQQMQLQLQQQQQYQMQLQFLQQQQLLQQQQQQQQLLQQPPPPQQPQQPQHLYQHSPQQQAQLLQQLSHMPPAQAPAAAEAAPAPPAEDPAATRRLAQLEAALSALKPQIEALLQAQLSAAQLASAVEASSRPATAARSSAVSPPRSAAAAAAPAAGPAAPLAAAFPTANAAGSGGEGPAARLTPGGLSVDVSNRLADRRSMSGLQIAAPLKAQDKPVLVHTTPAVVDEEAVASPQGAAASGSCAAAASGPAKQRDAPKAGRRPANLNTMRVAPSKEDPQSPRSPGRFSAWD